jgi:hypothetical protein
MLPAFRNKLIYSNLMPQKKLNSKLVFHKHTDSLSHLICYTSTESFCQLLRKVSVLLRNCRPSYFLVNYSVDERKKEEKLKELRLQTSKF